MRDFDRGRIELIIEVGEIKRAHTVAPERVPDAPGRPPQFAMMLRNRLSGADFAGVEQFEFDRILEFVFDREDGTTRIIVELFGQGNVAVTDGEYEVIDCLETVRLKSRTVVPGSRYEFPDSRTNPLTVPRDAFDREMEESDTDVVRTLATQLNFGGLYAEEVCTRAGIEKGMDIDDADEDDYDRLYEAIERLALDLRNSNFEPRMYFADDGGDGNGGDSGDGDGDANGDGDGDADDSSPDRVVDATPFPLEEHVELAAEPYDSFLAALDDYFFRLELADEQEPDPTDQRPDFEEEIAKYERIIDQQQGAIDGFEQEADALREQAESLYAEYGLIDDILSTIQDARSQDRPWDEIESRFEEGAERGIDAAQAVVDVDGSEGTVTIEVDGEYVDLEAGRGVEQNADRLYTEAKRVEEKKEGALAAIEDTREDLEDAKARRERWEADDGEDETEETDEEDRDDREWLSMPSVPIRENEPWYDRFRWFHTSDGYLVIGGRNADQNEELVKKYLEPGDTVFHTQAHGGPVTVLKATDPSEASSSDIELPDSSLEEAAQFAVSYASVWKDGRYAGDVYAVDSDQVTKTPESGEYLEKGGFAIRGDRTYYDDTPVDVAVGIQCEPYTRVIGGPSSAIEGQAATTISLEPGRYAQADAAKRVYRQFRERFEDESFVRKIASPDRIQHFMPPGGSRIAEE